MAEKKSTLNIAHRGARSLAPENTLAAARKAIEIGADMWELDVALTSDGEIILIHDDTFERTTNIAEVFPSRKKDKIHTFSMEEVRKLDFGSWFNATDPFKQIAAGAVSKAEQQSFVGLPPTTLREALTLTRDAKWRVNVEIKDVTGTPSDKDIVEKVVTLIGELKMVDSVMISSFNHAYIQRVKAANPAIATAALVDRPDADPAALVKRLGAFGYNPNTKYTNPDMVKALRQKGVEVFVWTVNDEPTLKALVEAGASGIFTDFPQLLKKIVVK